MHGTDHTRQRAHCLATKYYDWLFGSICGNRPYLNDERISQIRFHKVIWNGGTGNGALWKSCWRRYEKPWNGRPLSGTAWSPWLLFDRYRYWACRQWVRTSCDWPWPSDCWNERRSASKSDFSKITAGKAGCSIAGRADQFPWQRPCNMAGGIFIYFGKCFFSGFPWFQFSG